MTGDLRFLMRKFGLRFDVVLLEQRERLVEHMRTFMDMTELEQRLRLKRTVPSIEEYWGYRLGSSAVNVTLAVNESAPRQFSVLRKIKSLSGS